MRMLSGAPELSSIVVNRRYTGPAERGQPVHADPVLVALVLLEAFGALVFGPSSQLRSLADVLEERHAESARVSHTLDGNANDRSNSWSGRRKQAAELLELRVGRL